MSRYDPDSTEVSPQRPGLSDKSSLGGDFISGEVKSPRRRMFSRVALGQLSNIFRSPILKFVGVWLIVTILCIEIIKIFNQDFKFIQNISAVLAITFILSFIFKRISNNFPMLPTAVGLQWFGAIASRIWSIMILSFCGLFVYSCSQNPNAGIDMHIVAVINYMKYLIRLIIDQIF